MGWTTGLAIYFVVWWTVLFAILPWGVRSVSPEDVARGHAPSAPEKPHMLLKIAATSVVAAVVWGVIYWIIETGAISVRS